MRVLSLSQRENQRNPRLLPLLRRVICETGVHSTASKLQAHIVCQHRHAGSPDEVREMKSPGTELETAEVSNVSLRPILVRIESVFNIQYPPSHLFPPAT